tara:strand:+ start:14041 stop:14991 length:951 start_codon:yes stop_codon:yes gene_type:complete
MVTMKKQSMAILLILLSLPLLLDCRGRRYRGGENTREFEFLYDGKERSYYLYVPETLKPNPDVLFALHGGGGDPGKMMGLNHGAFDELADKHGFIVVYPAGIENQWNDGREVPESKAHSEKFDDAGFLLAIQDRLKKDYGVRKSYFTGISNGGFMSFRMGCEHPDRVDGIAPVTANLSEYLFEKCNPRGVPLLLINGTEDPLVPYDGGYVEVLGRKRGKIRSTDDSVRKWLKANGCPAPQDFSPAVYDTRNNDPDDGTVAKLMRFDCSVAVELVRIEGGGHTWPSGRPYLFEFMIGKVSNELDASRKIVQFFELDR